MFHHTTLHFHPVASHVFIFHPATLHFPMSTRHPSRSSFLHPVILHVCIFTYTNLHFQPSFFQPSSSNLQCSCVHPVTLHFHLSTASPFICSFLHPVTLQFPFVTPYIGFRGRVMIDRQLDKQGTQIDRQTWPLVYPYYVRNKVVPFQNLWCPTSYLHFSQSSTFVPKRKDSGNLRDVPINQGCC